MAMPAYAVIFRGLPACPCQVEWIPAFEAHCRRVIAGFAGTLSIAQMIGLYEKSGNTHGDPGGAGSRKGGGFTDFWVTGSLAARVVAEARQMGAPATWRRPANWDGDGGSEHVHSGLEGCPHATAEGLGQIAAVYANGDGLVGTAPDPGPRPVPHRTWREGINWAEEQEMADYADQLDRIEKKLDQSRKRDVALRKTIKSLGEAAAAVDFADAISDQVEAIKALRVQLTKIKRAIAQLDQDDPE